MHKYIHKNKKGKEKFIISYYNIEEYERVLNETKIDIEERIKYWKKQEIKIFFYSMFIFVLACVSAGYSFYEFLYKNSFMCILGTVSVLVETCLIAYFLSIKPHSPYNKEREYIATKIIPNYIKDEILSKERKVIKQTIALISILQNAKILEIKEILDKKQIIIEFVYKEQGKIEQIAIEYNLKLYDPMHELPELQLSWYENKYYVS